MPPFNVFKVFGGSNKSASNAYPPQGGPSSVSGRKLSRRRDRHSSHAQVRKCVPLRVAPESDDWLVAATNGVPSYAHRRVYQSLRSRITYLHVMKISEDDLSRHMPVNEDHGHYEAAPGMAHGSYMSAHDMPLPLHQSSATTPYAQFHEELEDSEDTQSDGEDGRKHNPENRSTHSRSVHGQSTRSNRGDPYMGRTPTPYHPASVTHSISDTQPRPIIINYPEPPLARSSRTRDRHRDHPDEHGLRASANVAETSPTTQYPHSGYRPSTQLTIAPAAADTNAHRRTTHRSRKESAPPYLVGPDVNNTYCYIVPRGTNVIFQDEDGHEITRVGKFHPMYPSREPSNPAARKHTVPIVVQDEFGQELYSEKASHEREFLDSVLTEFVTIQKSLRDATRFTTVSW
ncbi:hypothetical protein IMY05_C4235000400 [Salix suchowensis]|nr:hypothetical protein IMY05_C4235000400 [Salix suchowensis]